MPEAFDPYYTWLGISPKNQPADLYRLLGLQRFESDTVVIESAADQRMAHLRAFQTGPRGELAARILNELSAARIVLLDPQKRAVYEQQLHAAGPFAESAQIATSTDEPRSNRQLQIPIIGAAAAALLAIAAVVALYATSGKAPPTTESVPPTPATKSPLADQQARAELSSPPIDVLALVNVDKNVRHGKIGRQATGLDIVGGHPAIIEFPVKLPAEYQIDATVKRNSTNGMFSFVLLMSGHQFQFHFDSKTHKTFSSGVGLLEGKRNPDSPYSHHQEVLRKNEPTSMSLLVRTNSIQVIADGKLIFNWQGDAQNVSHVGDEQSDFGIITWDGSFEVQKLSLTPLAPRPSQSAVAGSPAEKKPTATASPAPAVVARPAAAHDVATFVPEQDSEPRVIPSLPPAPKIHGPNPAAASPPPQAAPLDASNSKLAAAALVIFKEDCYRCHGRDGSNEGGLNFILQSDKLIANRYVVPGDPSGSFLFKRLTEGTMPPEDEKPRPTTDQIAAIRKWIEAGAPQTMAPPTNRTFITNADVVRLIHDDVTRLDLDNRPFARYFTLTHLYNAGLSDDELQTYRLGLSKLVNSLSWGDRIVVPQAIDAAKTILRVDLRDFKWNDKTWDAILAQNPYSILPNTQQTRELAHETRTELPFVRGDWFVAAASVPPLYHQVLGIPESLAEMETLLRISATDDIQQLRVARAGFNKSGISRNNRLIERHETYFGAYWRSYDFGHSDGRANLFSHPLGPDQGPNSFRPDGGEIIFNLPNGLQAYMVANADGDRLDKAPLTIVSDPRRPDRAVVNGLSCMSCHIGGIHEKADEVRAAVHANLSAFSADELRAVDAIYPLTPKMRELQAKDAARFQAALKQTGTLPSRTEPVLMLVERFEQPLDLTLLSAELGFEPTTFLKLLDQAPESSRTLAALRAPGGTIQRQVFLDSLDTLIRELKLDRASTFSSSSTASAQVTPRAPALNAGERPDEQAGVSPRAGAPRTSANRKRRGKEAPVGDEVQPIATLNLLVEIPDIILSKDRRWAYFLNSSESEVERIDTERLAVDGTVVKTVGSAERMRLTPNGRVLYVCASPNGHDSQKESPGKFQVIAADTFQPSVTFSVPFDPWDFAPDDKKHLFVSSGSAQSAPVRLVNVDKQAVVAELFRSSERAAIRLSHDGRLLCAADLTGTISVFPVANLGGRLDQKGFRPLADLAGGALFEFSGDDRFLITSSGVIGRLGANRERKVPVVTTINRSPVIAIDPASNLVFTSTEDGQIKIYSTPSFDLRRSLNLNEHINAVAVDARAGLLYAVVGKKTRPGRNNYPLPDEFTVSNIAVYDVSDITGGKHRDFPNANRSKPAADNQADAAATNADNPNPRIDNSSSKAITSSNDLSPLKAFKLAASIPDLIVSADRQFVYFLNTSDGEIRRLDTQLLKLDDVVISTGPGAQRMRSSPDRKMLFVATAPEGHPREFERRPGQIIVVAANQFRVTDRFSIPFDPVDLAADDDNKLFTLPQGNSQVIRVFNVRKQAVISEPAEVGDVRSLELSRDGKSLVLGEVRGTQILSTLDLSKQRHPVFGRSLHALNFNNLDTRERNGLFAFSPDSRFIVTEDGRVGQVDFNADRNLREIAQVGKFDAAIFDASSKHLITSTDDNQLKVFSVPDFEVQHALNVGTRISAMALDGESGKLYAVTTPRIDRNPHGIGTVGDISVFDITNQLDK